MDSTRSRLLPMPKNSPFPQRPWMQNNSAAAAAPGATGLKGTMIDGGRTIFVVKFPNETIE